MILNTSCGKSGKHGNETLISVVLKKKMREKEGDGKAKP